MELYYTFIANNLTLDQMPAISDSGYSIWELAEFHCKSLCEAPEVGEECGWQSMCEVSAL